MTERLFLRLDEDLTQGPESGAPARTLRAWAIDAPLHAQVAHILSYREDLTRGHEVVERVLPDGAVRLVFSFGPGPGQPPSATLLGASSAPAMVRLSGSMDGLSVTLKAGATQALFGLPAGEIEGTTVPLDTLWHGDAALLLEQLLAATDDASRLRVLQAALLHRLRRREGAPSALVAEAARLMRRCAGQRAVRDVAAAVGVSERRLQQLFHAHVGLSPRTFSRLARLHGLLRTLRQQPHGAWADMAAGGGYYDQAHLANEFRALCGMTPGEFARRAISPSSKTGT